VSPQFLTPDNLINVATRSAFIAIIAVGATFVIASGGLDLSVGAMAAIVAGVMIFVMNAMSGPAPASGALAALVPALKVFGEGPAATLMAGVAVVLVAGALCGLVNGLVVTLGRIEPFIVTLGTMGIFRALLIWLAAGGTITMRDFELRELYRPVYSARCSGCRRRSWCSWRWRSWAP
jgi:ribose transport system permease protein